MRPNAAQPPFDVTEHVEQRIPKPWQLTQLTGSSQQQAVLRDVWCEIVVTDGKRQAQRGSLSRLVPCSDPAPDDRQLVIGLAIPGEYTGAKRPLGSASERPRHRRDEAFLLPGGDFRVIPSSRRVLLGVLHQEHQACDGHLRRDAEKNRVLSGAQADGAHLRGLLMGPELPFPRSE